MRKIQINWGFSTANLPPQHLLSSTFLVVYYTKDTRKKLTLSKQHFLLYEVQTFWNVDLTALYGIETGTDIETPRFWIDPMIEKYFEPKIFPWRETFLQFKKHKPILLLLSDLNISLLLVISAARLLHVVNKNNFRFLSRSEASISKVFSDFMGTKFKSRSFSFQGLLKFVSEHQSADRRNLTYRNQLYFSSDQTKLTERKYRWEISPSGRVYI